MMNIIVFHRYTEDGPEFTEEYMNMTAEQTKKIVNHWNNEVEVGDCAVCKMEIVWG